MAKNLEGLGNYIANLIEQKTGGSFNAAAKELGISAGELSALRKGQRQSPSPLILKAIADAFDGDYAVMMCLSGYAPFNGGGRCEIVKVPILENVLPDRPLMSHITGYRDVPQSWLQEGKEYFILKERQEDQQAWFYVITRIDTNWRDSDWVIASWDACPATLRMVFKAGEEVELLARHAFPARVIIKNPVIYGIVERIDVVHEESKR